MIVGGTVITLNGFAVPVLAPAARTGRCNVEHDRLQFRLQLSSAVPRRVADRLFRDQQRERTGGTA